VGRNGLGTSIWCGIVAVALGGAAVIVKPWIGAAILIVGLAWLGRACYLDYQRAGQH